MAISSVRPGLGSELTVRKRQTFGHTEKLIQHQLQRSPTSQSFTRKLIDQTALHIGALCTRRLTDNRLPVQDRMEALAPHRIEEVWMWMSGVTPDMAPSICV